MTDQPSDWREQVDVEGRPDGGTFYLGFICHDMPVGGRVELDAPGPSPEETLHIDTSITHPNQSMMGPLTWPPDHRSVAVLEYSNGGGPSPPPGASISIVVAVPGAPGGDAPQAEEAEVLATKSFD